MALTIDQLNTASAADAVALLDGIYEHSPWVAEAALAERPFQSLQHRAADLKIHIALTRAAVETAAAVLDSGAAGAVRQAAVSKAKHRAAESGLLVLRQCIQLHGGIGYTDEYDVGLYLRRGMVIANQYGSASLHRRRFMALAPEDVE